MENKLDDGGPAFPMSGDPGVDFDRGMALRDWFAGMALQGQASFEGMEGCDAGHWAGMAYELADAMIQARKPKP